MQYDVIIIGAGPGGIFSAYELSKLCPEKRIAVFEEGQPLEKRRCPIDGEDCQALRRLSDVRDHERLRRRGRVFRRKI